MRIIHYFDLENTAPILAQLRAADWGAARFLAELLEQNTFHTTLGGEGELLLLIDGEKLISFATLTRQDCIRDESMYPWVGFVFTQPEYRGNRYSQQLIAHAEHLAVQQNYRQIYIATDHIGLYEKYGYTYLDNRVDCWGEDSRILYKML